MDEIKSVYLKQKLDRKARAMMHFIPVVQMVLRGVILILLLFCCKLACDHLVELSRQYSWLWYLWIGG